MADDQVILVGWHDVARACGVSVQVMKRIAKRYEMPYVRLCGKVTIPKATLVGWIAGLCDVVDGNKQMDGYVMQRLKNLKRI